MNRLRTIHLIIGVTGLIAFILTGQYMAHVHDGLKSMPDGPRMMHRSAHIYLLWASLLNLLLGPYLTIATHARARLMQAIASAMLLAAPFMLCYSFLKESNHPQLLRPITQYAIFLAAAGGVMHAIAGAWRRDQSR